MNSAPNPLPLEVADRCRAAGLSFLAASRVGWDKRALARWLVADYHPLTTPRDAAYVSLRRHFSPPPQRLMLSVDEVRLRGVVADCRSDIVDALRELVLPGRVEAFGLHAVLDGLVTGVRDELGTEHWAPVRSSRMRLADRVLSLFAVDALARREDYVNLLLACGLCGLVTFEGHGALHCGYCGAPTARAEAA